MTDDTWLRDALRAATTAQPSGGARASGALHRAAQRRRQRLVMGSFTAVAAVFLAASVTAGGGAGSTGLQPVGPGGSPSPWASYGDGESPTPSAEVSGSATAIPAGEPAASGAPAPPPGPEGSALTSPGGPPSAPPAMDVFFLVDTTAGMQIAHKELAATVNAIVPGLGAAKLRHGYGRYSDWVLNEAATPVYETLVPLSAGAGPLPDLKYRGGGSDEAEAATIGLDGVLGNTHVPYTTESDPAGFGRPAKGIVVLVTDARIKQGGGYPMIDDVGRRLVLAGVTVVAIQVLSNADANLTYADLATITEITGGLAAGPVDCDGDGRIDVAKGAPLVCTLAHDGPVLGGMAGALLALARQR